MSKKTYGKQTNRNQRQKGRYKDGNQNQRTKDEGMDKVKSNDITWWNKSPLFSDVTRVPFNRIYGAPMDTEELQPIDVSVPTGVFGNDIAFPSVMRINYYPVIGFSRNFNSPVNRCFTSIQAAIYAKTTGAMQFTQANLAFNTMAVDSILTNIAMVKRALGLSLLYSSANLAYPRMLIASCGIDPYSVIGKQDEIRRQLNDCIQNLNALAVPGILDIYTRHYALTHNVYCDEDDVKSHLYAFVPMGYYIHRDAGFSETYEGEHLEYNGFEWDSNNTISANYLLGIIRSQLLAIRHSTAWYLVSGSIQRTFPESNLLTVEIVPVDYVQEPVYDRNIRYQINNMTLTGGLDDVSLHVHEDVVKDQLIFEPYKVTTGFDKNAVPSVCLLPSNVLNSFDGNIDAEFIMEATRLMVCGHLETVGSEKRIYVSTSGTEICASAWVYYMTSEQSERPWKTLAFTTIMNDAKFPTKVSLAAHLAYLSQFKNGPRVYVANTTGITPPVGDLYRWTLVDSTSLEGLHECALLSIYTTIATIQ